MAHLANLTVPATSVPSTTLGFNLYSDLSLYPDEYWNGIADGGGSTRIYDALGTTEYPREIVTAIKASKTGEKHALVPLSALSGNVFQIHGDMTTPDYAPTDPFGRNATWANYGVVLHFEGGITDSTGNTTPTSTNVSFVPGAIGDGGAFFGSNSRVDATFAARSDAMLMFQAWGESDVTPTSKVLVGIADQSLGTHQHHLFADNSSNFRLRTNAGGSGSTTSPAAVGDTAWHLDVARILSNTMRYHYRDGVQVGTATADRPVANMDRFTVGVTADSTPFGWWDGLADEARLRWDDPGADYISMDYQNQSSPGTFYTVTPVGTGPDLPIFDHHYRMMRG